MREVIVAGNWKMNATKEMTNTLVMGVLNGLSDVNAKVIACVPFPYLSQAVALTTHSQLNIGAQNLNTNESGAFTGEVSAEMIKDLDVQYVIVGHSERRSLYGETDKIVAEKIEIAINNGLTPLFCVGELLSEREEGNTEAVVGRQVRAVIDRVGIEAFRDIIVAYEPVWAIGTGVTATPEQAQETHAFIRSVLANNDNDIAQSIPILYGGSMNPINAEERKVEVSFFAMTMPGFPVQFGPKVNSMQVVPGKFYTTSYIAKNNTDKEVIGQAIPSVAPTDAALYFKKLECFCFNRQVFKPHEEIEMSLRFVVEPEMDERIKDVSLSYNFFKLES